jgi:hypothetical protein
MKTKATPPHGRLSSIAFIGQEPPYPIIGNVTFGLSVVVSTSVDGYVVENQQPPPDLNKVELEHIKNGLPVNDGGGGGFSSYQLARARVVLQWQLAHQFCLRDYVVMLYRKAQLSVIIPDVIFVFVDD